MIPTLWDKDQTIELTVFGTGGSFFNLVEIDQQVKGFKMIAAIAVVLYLPLPNGDNKQLYL